jgi:hypothetical protein
MTSSIDLTNVRVSHTIQDLPPDILYEIFHTLTGGWITLDTSNDLWIASRVCQHWRNVAFEFPGLWSHISIDKYDIIQVSPHAVSIIETCLDRSGGCLLHIRAYLDQLLVNANILETLVLHSHRWHELDLQISLFLLRILGTQTKRKGFPSLSRLTLSLVDEDGQSFRGDPLEAFQSAPKLESVSVNTRRSSLVKLPWSNVRHLSLREISVGEFLRVFGSTVNLVECSLLVGPPYKLQTDNSGGDVSLPLRQSALKTLFLCCKPDVLDDLELPALESLYIAETTLSKFSFDPLISLVHRSASDIQILGLSGILLHDDGLHDALSALPNLVELILADWTPTTRESWSLNNLVADLTVYEGSMRSPLVPKLRTLVVDDYSSGRTVDGDLLASMVESRMCGAGGGLLKLALHGVSLDINGLDVFGRLRQFKEEMTFVVTMGHSDIVENNFGWKSKSGSEVSIKMKDIMSRVRC